MAGKKRKKTFTATWLGKRAFEVWHWLQRTMKKNQRKVRFLNATVQGDMNSCNHG